MGAVGKGSRCKTLRARAPSANAGIQAVFFLMQAFLAFVFYSCFFVPELPGNFFSPFFICRFAYAGSAQRCARGSRY